MNTIIVYFRLALHGPNNFAKPKTLTYTHVDILKSIYPSDTPIYIVLDSYVSILLSVCIYGCLGLLLLLTPVLIHHVEHTLLAVYYMMQKQKYQTKGKLLSLFALPIKARILLCLDSL
jgi:hypothetical protein